MPEVTRSQLVGYAVAAIVVLVLGVRFVHDGGGAVAPVPDTAGAARAAQSGSASRSGVRIDRPRRAPALVHVAGAVRRPGVYRLSADARVKDAVRLAGGARRGGDVNAINLAAKVADGQQVVVPTRAPTGAASAASIGVGAGAPPSAVPISLNSATAEQLDTLDGVGPATARKIIDWRTQHGGFRSVQDLGQVPGIGPKRLAALKDKVQP